MMMMNYDDDDDDAMMANYNRDTGCPLMLKWFNQISQQLSEKESQTNQAKPFTIKLIPIMFLTHAFKILITQYCDEV